MKKKTMIVFVLILCLMIPFTGCGKHKPKRKTTSAKKSTTHASVESEPIMIFNGNDLHISFEEDSPTSCEPSIDFNGGTPVFEPWNTFLEPGREIIQPFYIRNNGSVDCRHRLYFAFESGRLPESCIVKIYDKNYECLFSADATNFTVSAPFIDPQLLKVGETKNLYCGILLKTDGNEYQNEHINFSLCADALPFDHQSIAVTTPSIADNIDIDIIDSAPMGINAFLPGDTHVSYVTVKNVGNVPVQCNFAFSNTTTSGQANIADVIKVRAGTNPNALTYLGVISELSKPHFFTVADLGTLQPNQEKTVWFSLEMNINVGNEYQGGELSFDFIVNATKSPETK